MNITLTPEVRKFVEQKVMSGRYPSPDEVVNDLLTLIQHQEELSPQDLEELRAEVDGGIDDAKHGRFVEFTAENIIAERHAANGGRAPGRSGGQGANKG